jgi:hypothetical protein
MHDLDLLSNHDIPEDGEEGEDSGHGCFPVDNKERDMVDLESIGEVAYASSAFVSVCYDHNFMASVDELGGQLIDVTFDTSGLRKEEVADHGNAVRHFD